jgi:hypothetical protein
MEVAKMSKKVIALLKKRLEKYNIRLDDDEIKELGVCGVIDLIVKQDNES